MSFIFKTSAIFMAVSRDIFFISLEPFSSLAQFGCAIWAFSAHSDCFSPSAILFSFILFVPIRRIVFLSGLSRFCLYLMLSNARFFHLLLDRRYIGLLLFFVLCICGFL